MKKGRRVRTNIIQDEEAAINIPEAGSIKLVEINKQATLDFGEILKRALKIIGLESEYQKLSVLRDKNDNLVFSEKNPGLNLDLLEILKNDGITKFERWISTVDLSSENIIWSHEIFNEMMIHELLDADIFLNRKQPVKGVGVCGRCKNQYLFVTMKQTRASDEPITVFFYCPNCGNRWRE